MTTHLDLTKLARRILHGGDPTLAGQIAVLAIETYEDTLLEDTQQSDTDKDVLNDKPLLEALEDGTDDQAAAYENHQGEVPIATVLEMSAIAKRLLGAGHHAEARAINMIVGSLGRFK